MDARDTDLHALAQILREGWLAIAAVVAVLVGSVLAIDLVVRTPLYRSESVVLFSKPVADGFGVGSESDADRSMRNELEVAESRPVVSVIEDLYGDEPRISVKIETGRDVLRFAASDPDPDVAAEMADTYATTFLEVRETAILDEFLDAAQAVQNRIDEVDAALALLGENPSSAADRSQRDLLLTQRSLLVQRLGDVALNSELVSSGSARIVSLAEPGENPVSPSPLRDSLVAAVGGLVLGVGFVYLRRILRGTDPRRQSIDRIFEGIPTLGEAPLVRANAQELALASLQRPQSRTAEAFRTLRTAVQFLSSGDHGQIILVTSARPGDGKTTVAANLATLLAENGRRTVLIDADIRNPTLTGQFGIATENLDLTAAIQGECDLREVTWELIDLPELTVVPSARRVNGGSAELISSDSFSLILQDLATEYDYVVVDSSPLLAVADGLSIAKQADRVLVAVGRTTEPEEAARMLRLLKSVDVVPDGVVHNGVRRSDDGYGAYYGELRSQRIRSKPSGLHFRRPLTMGRFTPSDDPEGPTEDDFLAEWEQAETARR